MLPQCDVRSSVTLPLLGTGRTHGVLALDSIASDRSWPEELLHRLQLVAEIFASVLARKEGADAITTPYGGAAMRADYLELCREAVRNGAPHATEMLAGTQQVLDRARGGFAFEYSSPAAKAERWFAVSVVPLNRPEGGAVVSHTEVTERKRAEVQAQRSRQELAHFARVSTMGELTASLAHELRQPLTGIMTNAQAARKLLGMVPPDLTELRASLEDIIADNRRAADVIQRLRDMLRKGDLRQGKPVSI